MGLRTGRSESQSGSIIGPTDRYKSGSRPSAWCDPAPGTVSSRCARGASIWASRRLVEVRGAAPPEYLFLMASFFLQRISLFTVNNLPGVPADP
jgi:hypothetical protein